MGSDALCAEPRVPVFSPGFLLTAFFFVAFFFVAFFFVAFFFVAFSLVDPFFGAFFLFAL
ncbi:MAG: hypothetical protein AAF612_04315 [Planctomycetota bacterium]